MINKRKGLFVGIILFLIVVIGIVYVIAIKEKPMESSKILEDKFTESKILEETSTPEQTKSDDWWLNSGAYFINEGGIGKTVQGDISDVRWEKEYLDYNPTDTDKGKHPQNIFRLITINKWKNFEQSAYYKIKANHLGDSERRSGSNGLLLMNRYQDGDNLYYAGIRVDGNAVIKKKINGEYFTMNITPAFVGEYNRLDNPNLLPLNTWIGLRTELQEIEDGTLQIELFIDRGINGNWELILESIDDGQSYGGEIINEPGHAGIRTDFMDVIFDNYHIEEQ